MGILDYIFPQGNKCIFCGYEIPDVCICEDCYKSLPFIEGKTCLKCGGKVFANEDVCIDCKSNDIKFEKGFCILDYKDEVQMKILKFKSGGYKNIGYTLSHLILDKFKTLDIPFDEIIPVPIHENRRKLRGFNQSEILCEELKKYYGRVHPELLIRWIDTPHQTGLDRNNRKTNLDGAFKVSDKKRIKGKIILLVDDNYACFLHQLELYQHIVQIILIEKHQLFQKLQPYHTYYRFLLKF